MGVITIIYSKTLYSKISIIVVFLLATMGLIFMFRDRSWNLIWAIPFWPILLWIIIIGFNEKIEISENQITQKFYRIKPRTMNWEDVVYIYQDRYAGFYVYNLITNKLIKPKKITFSGMKNTEELLAEIVKRAPHARIDPVIKDKLAIYANSKNRNK